MRASKALVLGAALAFAAVAPVVDAHHSSSPEPSWSGNS
jgi:hypothetical protein